MRRGRRGLITRPGSRSSAAFVALVASGLPEFVVVLVTGEPVACAADCDGSDGQKHCPRTARTACALRPRRRSRVRSRLVQIGGSLAVAGALSRPRSAPATHAIPATRSFTLREPKRARRTACS